MSFKMDTDVVCSAMDIVAVGGEGGGGDAAAAGIVVVVAGRHRGFSEAVVVRLGMAPRVHVVAPPGFFRAVACGRQLGGWLPCLEASLRILGAAV
jgi:hypothetical protein